MTKANTISPKLVIRNSTESDIPDIIELCKKAYPKMQPYTQAMLLAQINNFPDGHFVAVYESKIVGFCACFVIDQETALKKHTWKEITGAGYASRHNPNGEYLYGMEVCVDPDYRGLRIGQRLYTQRKNLCKFLKLKGIVFCARLAEFNKKRKNSRQRKNT